MDRHETVARKWFEEFLAKWREDEDGHIRDRADFLRKNYPDEPKGQCGECRWWDHRSRENCKLCMHKDGTIGARPMADNTCPRFERRADKYEELAREWWSTKEKDINVWYDKDVASLADFLRERVTVREGE